IRWGRRPHRVRSSSSASSRCEVLARWTAGRRPSSLPAASGPRHRPPTQHARRSFMATSSEWVAGARPRTLPAAATPVLVGTGAAAQVDAVDPLLAVLALVVALALQVG